MTCNEYRDPAFEQLERLLRSRSPHPPPALTDRIVQAVVQDRRRRLQRQRWGPLASLAAAACVLMALALVVERRPSAVPDEHKQPVASVRQQAPSEPTVAESVDEARDAVASLTSRTADATVAQTRSLWLRLPPGTLQENSLRASLQPPAHSLREAGENVSACFEPVRQSAHRAVELFLRGLPVEGARQAPL